MPASTTFCTSSLSVCPSLEGEGPKNGIGLSLAVSNDIIQLKYVPVELVICCSEPVISCSERGSSSGLTVHGGFLAK